MIKFSPIMDYGRRDVDLISGPSGVYIFQGLVVLQIDSNRQAL